MIDQGEEFSESSRTLLTTASVHEQWPSDDLARVVDELLRLNIEIERRDDGVGIVGSEHTEPLLGTSRQPVRIAVYRLIRGEQARQQKRYRDEAWSHRVEATRFYSE